MLTNYFKIAWRNLIKGKSYSVINITGMGIGIGICLLIFLFVKEEWSYDQFHSKSDRIYRAWVKEHFKGDIFFNSVTPYLLGTEIRDNFPEVDDMVRYTTINSLVKKEGQVDEETIHLADPGFFSVFDFELQSGEVNVLDDVHNLAISSRMAAKYFGDSSPLGKILTLQVGGEWTDFTVGAVVENVPTNSSIQFDLVIPFDNTTTFMSEPGRKCWTCVSVETYFLLNETNDEIAFESNIAPFIDKKVVEDYKPGEYIIGLQPLSDIHLNNDIPVGIVAVSDGSYPYILSGIALLILILACINFTTLSVGRSVSRSKEVGIRKVTGATRKQLMFQFWSEAFITVFAGVLIGIVLAKIGLPFFNQLADKALVLSPEPSILSGLAIIFIITGILSGIYPALVLSGFKPIDALSGSLVSGNHSRGSILSGLVGFQFVLSLVLIICAGIMQNQMRFLQDKNLGFDKSYMVTFPYNVSGQNMGEMWEETKLILPRLEEKVETIAGVQDLTNSSHTFGTPGWLQLGYTDKVEGRFKKFNMVQIDENFLPMMDIPLREGRNFSKEIATDMKGVIINPAMVRAFNITDPVGSYLPEPFEEFKVIGVAEDFHFSSLHNPILPLVMSYDMLPLVQKAQDLSYIDSPNPKFTIKLSSENLPATLTRLEEAWKEVAPDQAFDYSFIDDDLGFLYRREAKLSSILSVSTILALLIACMGLFGISALKIAYKTKEIGIRKVLGASSSGILLWLSKGYLGLILIATTIAIPISWLAMDRWLQDFEFHVDIQWWVFVLAASITSIVALFTISFQSIRASLSNPVDALRNE